MNSVTINVYLDDRKQSKSGKYPVLLKIYSDRSAKYYPVFHNYQKLKLSQEDFKSSYKALKPKKQHKEYSISIGASFKRANDIIEKLDPFTFPSFEVEYLGNTQKSTDLLTLFETIIFENEEQGRIKNAYSYQSAVRSLIQYFEYVRNKEVKSIAYKEITPKLLQDYEQYMTDKELISNGKVIKKKHSISTVGCYMRSLRSVMNRAIDEGYINSKLYPFGKSKSKYQIPAGRKIKKGLNKEQVKALYEYDLSDNEKAAKARDFWFLSYVCNGMQFKDIAHLKYSNVTGNYFHFIRHKTKNTTKANQTPVIVPITEHVKYMIDKYGNKKQSGNYIFPIISNEMSPRDQTRAVSNFTRFVSQNLKKVAQDLGITMNLANMVARHTFATSIIRSGKPVEFAQKAMGHQSKRTTDTYFAGFEDEELMQVNSSLLDFES